MFDLDQLIQDHTHDAHPLFDAHVNPALGKVLRILGFDIQWQRGEGPYLYDQHGNEYLDCLGGYGTFALGRNHPAIISAIKQAMDAKLPSLPKMGVPRLSGLLAKQLCELAPGNMQRVYFGNSGAEAVEAAIKFARAATGRPRIVHCRKSYHGLTAGALAITGAQEFREGFGPLHGPSTEVPFNDPDQLAHELTKGDVAAFIVEPIQGKGVNMPDPDYLPKAAQLCKDYGALLIADEVQAGLGRTGKMFACEHFGIEPDIITIAKALSGGFVPVGATLCRADVHDKVYSSLERCVVHSTTFGQIDLAMVVGLATLHTLIEDGIVDNAAAMGDRLMAGLMPMVDEFDLVKQVRGKGLMVAIEFGPPRSLGLKVGWKAIHAADKGLFPQAVIVPLLTEHRILSQVAGHQLDVIKFLPALTITQKDVDHMIASLRTTIAACHKFPGPAWRIATSLGRQAIKRS